MKIESWFGAYAAPSLDFSQSQHEEENKKKWILFQLKKFMFFYCLKKKWIEVEKASD